MRTVNISHLKAHLSSHIQYVREGEEVLICDRSQPVARIVPVRTDDHSAQERRLIARGALQPPQKRRPPSAAWPQPPGSVSREVMARIWREERDER
jgi:prevent-host-death family protein